MLIKRKYIHVDNERVWLVSTFSLFLDVNRAIELIEKLQSSELIIFMF